MTDSDRAEALRTFVHGALAELDDPHGDAGQAHRNGRAFASLSAAAQAAEIDREGDLGVGPERPPELSPADHAWARLSPADQAAVRAGGNEIADAWDQAFGDEAEGDEEADDDELEETSPLSGNQLRQAVHETVVGLLEDADGAWRGAGFDPEQVLLDMATMPAADWISYCEEVGHDPSVRPGREDLPIELQVLLTERNMYANLEREQRGYRAP